MKTADHHGLFSSFFVQRLLLGACAFLSITHSFSQSFPVDPEGKINYYQVTSVDSMTQVALYMNANDWLNSRSLTGENLIQVDRDSLAGRISGSSGFMVYSQGGILKKVSGQITYSFQIEVKDSRYRYHFSNFIFHYYKEDRNYSMQPTGKTKPLEEVSAGGWQKLWNKHRKTVHARMSDALAGIDKRMKSRKTEMPTAAAKTDW